MLAFLLPVALAATPTITVTGNNTIVGEILVAASLADAEAIIADPVKMATIDGTTNVTQDGMEGSCKRLNFVIPNVVASISYRAKACPQGAGWIYTLISSDDLTEYHSSWSATQEGEQTRIRYEIRTIPSIPVPQFIVTRQSKTAVTGFLTRLGDYLD
ncbi:MAG: hypothetical protein ACI8RZ_001555 [Myxococcota bacterium]|jgi:hypothetical protein